MTADPSPTRRDNNPGLRTRTHVMVMPGGGRGGGGRGGRGRGRGRGIPPDAFALGGEERLQKFLSHAGLDSRRQCEQMILDGRVRVNGKMVKELGFKVRFGWVGGGGRGDGAAVDCLLRNNVCAVLVDRDTCLP